MAKKQKTDGQNRRGRPSLQDGERGTYNHILLGTHVLRKVEFFKERSLVRDDQKNDLIDEMLEAPDTASYYWKLVYTIAFEEFKRKCSEKEYTLRKVAEEAKVCYHNLKKLFSGKGSSVISSRFMMFYYQNGIDVQEIRLRKEIISEAYYCHLVHLRNNLK